MLKDWKFEITIVIVRQYRQISRTCKERSNAVLIGQFPARITGTKQYGKGVQSQAIQFALLGKPEKAIWTVPTE